MLRANINQLISGVNACSLFPEKPLIHFYPEVEECPVCGSGLKINKTRVKTVITMDIGAFKAHETILECKNDNRFFPSKLLRSRVPAKCTYGFDVIEYVGKALFIHCRNNREIMLDLAGKKNINISERNISNLGRKFVIYLALAHRESQDKIKEAMKQNGGYVLHIDGTCESDSPMLFCGIDGISELILDNVKIPSEKKELIVPFLERIKKQYGNPLALVHDMGRGILAAVEEVFPGLLDYICHFHFLRDIGKDLLHSDNQAVAQSFQKHKIKSLLRQKAKYLEGKIENHKEHIEGFISDFERGDMKEASCEYTPATATYILIHWALKSSKDLKGYGFPFDLSNLCFYRRLKTIYKHLGKVKDIAFRHKIKNNRTLINVWTLLDSVMHDATLSEAIENLETKSMVFEKLRESLRIAMPEGKKGLNDNGDETDIRSIEERVKVFRKWLTDDKSQIKIYAKMIEQIDKYWGKLFADPIEVETSHGTCKIAPQRTNNILEQFFRGEKRRIRKKSGTSSLSKSLKTILADTPFVKNLENPEYRAIILDGCENLAERFSKIDSKLVCQELEEQQKKQEKIIPEMRKLISSSNLPEKISIIFFNESNFYTSRHLRS